MAHHPLVTPQECACRVIRVIRPVGGHRGRQESKISYVTLVVFDIKTHTRCLNDLCRKIPTKGEINIMKSNGIDKEFVPERNCEIEGYRCLFCNYITETVEN